jgi:hypothetical protein
MTDASTAVSSRPAVALVHGAFADSSGWNDVAGQLQAAGIAVQAIGPKNPAVRITGARPGTARGDRSPRARRPRYRK